MSSGLVRCSQSFVTGAFSVAETLAAIASFSFSLLATALFINAFCLVTMLGRKLRGEVLRFEHLPNLDSASSPGMGLGQRLTQSIVSFSDLHCQIQKPATSSLVSAKGPSITVRLFAENLTRAPFELACSPSAASITPALVSSSLNLPISARSFSLGIMPASEFLLALTITMNRMVVSPYILNFVLLPSLPPAR